MRSERGSSRKGSIVEMDGCGLWYLPFSRSVWKWLRARLSFPARMRQDRLQGRRWRGAWLTHALRVYRGPCNMCMLPKKHVDISYCSIFLKWYALLLQLIICWRTRHHLHASKHICPLSFFVFYYIPMWYCRVVSCNPNSSIRTTILRLQKKTENLGSWHRIHWFACLFFCILDTASCFLPKISICSRILNISNDIFLIGCYSEPRLVNRHSFHNPILSQL